MPVPKLLTVSEVAGWLTMSESWVREHATGRRKPIMPSVRLGRSIRFNEIAVQKWLDEMAVLANRQKGRVA